MASHYFIGRQPILDADQQLYAYELLFRNGNQNQAPGDIDEDRATAEVITTAFTEIGLGHLVGGRMAFINIPQLFLDNTELLPLPPEQVVLEVLETVTISEEGLDNLRALKNRGFTLALDDFINNPSYEPVLPLVDIIKLDITQIERSSWQSQIEELRSYDCKILAEKVETEDEYRALKSMGVDYYQGYFFARPRIISGRRLGANKVSLLQLLARINNPDTDLEELQDLVTKDVAISVRALNYVNSPAQGLNRRIDSVREAIIYLGRQTIKSWVTLFAMSQVEDKPNELITMALVRAKLCELLALATGQDDIDVFFTTGLFSNLDAFMDAPLGEVLEKMSVSPDMSDALLKHEGVTGEALRCALEMESAEDARPTYGGLDEYRISDLHVEAVKWADASLRELGVFDS